MHDFSFTCLYTIGNKVVQVNIVTMHIVFHVLIVALPSLIILIEFAYQLLTKFLTNSIHTPTTMYWTNKKKITTLNNTWDAPA